MSNPGDQDATPIEPGPGLLTQLAGHLALGCRPRAEWRIGTEHEKFGFRLKEQTPPPYQPDGIEALLQAFAADPSLAWEPIADSGHLIGLKGRDAHRGASISLEPAGQFELSGAPLASLHETRAEMAGHFDELHRAVDRSGTPLGFLPLGFHPTATRAQMPWMPKSRYAIMRRYMAEVGSLGLDMMQRTCTVQVNLDFGSEADMRRKLQTALALQPVATALFASSPFRDGKPSGFMSTRAHIWTDTDNARAGMPPAFFEPGFGFERFVDWVLDVPMYFVGRDGALLDVAGASFRGWLAGREPRLEGVTPTLGDFDDHLTTVFTDVRLKRFLEMRGSDAGSPEMMLAQSALWVGLLYDDAALSAAHALVRRHDWPDYVSLRADVPRNGLSARWGSGTVRDLAHDMVAIAGDGLRARNLSAGAAPEADERRYLEPLHAIVAGVPNQAEHWLARYHGAWNGNTSRIFAEAII
nr:glutamate--cysteine ligase [uncultured Lichenicoccus sp.]